MSNFSTADKVQQTIRAGDDVEFVRSRNRTKVLDAANCKPPLDDQTAEDLGIKINCNWGELLVILTQARDQLINAFMQNAFFFTVKLPLAPADHQADWEAFITQEINRPLRESLAWFELCRSRWSSVVTHGVGPMMWMHADRWLPKFRSMADLRIPTDTTLDFDNLGWFAVRIAYTLAELIDEVFNDHPNNHWDKKAVAKILKNYKEINVTDATNNYNWETDAEKLAELLHQDGGFYGGDAMPTIPLFGFYFRDTDEDGRNCWKMRVVPETGAVTGASDEDFLWTSEEPVADNWQQLLHCQYGDLSTDAPFKYHSIRGLGFILLEPTFYTNLTRCRMLQHLHDNFNVWLKVTDPTDKARSAVQEFGNLGVLRSGVSIVPQAERHQIDPQMIEMAMSQLKQLQGEASSSYTQQADTGTQKEQTAFETRVKNEQVNAMMGSILMMAFKYESFAYREICRRFCLKDSRDPDIVKFQSRCKARGIPMQWLDVEHWEVEPVTPLGMGNPTIAQAAAQQLMQVRPMLNPQAQNEIVHENILTITKDPRKAARWAPITGKPAQSDATREAIGMFATLMIASPHTVPPPQNNYTDQINALLPLLSGKIQMITQKGLATPDEGVGMNNVLTYLQQAIHALSQDPKMKQEVKQFGDAVGKLGNLVKALVQRGQEAMKKQQEQAQQQNGHDPAAMAKVQATQMLAGVKARTALAKAKQDAQLKQAEFSSEQQRKNLELQSDIHRDQIKLRSEAHLSRLRSLQPSTAE